MALPLPLARKRRPADLPRADLPLGDEARAEEEGADPLNRRLPVKPAFLAMFPWNP